MARKFGANCSKCQRSTEQQQSIKCFKIHGKDLLQNNDFHITSSIFLLSSVLVFYFFLILFFNSIVYRFFIARIFGVLPEYFRDWGGCRPPPPPRLVRLCLCMFYPVYPCLPQSMHILPRLSMFTPVYPCFTPFTHFYPSLSMFCYV